MDEIRRYFKRITRIAQRYYNLHMSEGLTAQEANALRMISHAKQLSQQQLADFLGEDKSQITRMVNRLEKEGYITRIPSTEDKRVKLVLPTEKAHAVREMDVEWNNRYYEWLTSTLTAEEKEQFLATLEKLAMRALESRKNGFRELEDRE